MIPPKIAILFKADGDHIQNVYLILAHAFSYSFQGASSSLQKSLSEWIESYLSGKPESPLPIFLNEQGSFQEKVIEGLLSIPFGCTLSYSGLAEKIGIPKGARAVGNACGKNPSPLLIPCHRIIEKNGKLGGFALDLEIKKRLLLFERQHNCIF